MTVIERLKRLLIDAKTGLKFNQLLKHFKASERLSVEVALTDLVESNLVEMKGTDIGRSVFYASPSLIDEGKGAAPTYDLILTAPEFLKRDLPESLETKKCIDLMLRQSQKSLLVINPFLDTWIVETNEEGIRNLAKKGVEFVILTREVRKNPETLKASLRLYEFFTSYAPDPGKLKMLEFYIPIKHSDRSRLFTGLHAKAMISDERLAYIGSANWTIESMSRNVEVGIMTDDPRIVRHLIHLFELVVTDAVQIDLKRLYEKATDRKID